jgi:hypothetical protein
MSPEQARYQLTFAITVDGLVDFLRWRQRRLNLVGAILAVAMLAVNVLLLVAGFPLLFVLLLSIPGLVLLIAAVMPWFDRWRVRRYARSLLGATANFGIGPTGIQSDRGGMTGDMEWSSVTGIVDTGKVVVVSRDRMPMAWIPNSAFASHAERREIVAYMREAISGAQQTPEPSKQP